jgi:MFS family permease
MGLGAVLSLASGLLVEAWARHDPDPFPVYAAIFLAGTLAGYLGCVYLARIPEPRMIPGTLGSVREVIAAPFRDSRFRRLLSFVGLWTFAANLAAPFFAVYLLEHLGLSVGWVLGLSVFSQVAHALSLRLWGRMAERRSNRVVLACACPAFLLSVALWPISSLPIGPVGLGGLLVLIHALAGVSTAGVNLCAGNLALKEAPKGKGTAYLAGNGLVAGVAATLAPLLAGIASDGLQASGASLAFLGLVLSDLDFVFLVGALLGLLAMASLARVEEAGEPQERIRVLDLYAEALRFVGQTTTVGGLRRWAAFPFARLRTLLKRRPRANPDDGRTRSSSRR